MTTDPEVMFAALGLDEMAKTQMIADANSMIEAGLYVPGQAIYYNTELGPASVTLEHPSAGFLSAARVDGIERIHRAGTL